MAFHRQQIRDSIERAGDAHWGGTRPGTTQTLIPRAIPRPATSPEPRPTA